MAEQLGLIKGATEAILGIGEVSIDNFTFKLFYKWSVSLFIASSVTVCSSQFFGDPIACESADDSIDEEVINAYCWMYSHFDMPPDYNVSRQQQPVSDLVLIGFFMVSGFLHSAEPGQNQPVQHLLPVGLSLLHDPGKACQKTKRILCE